MRDCQRDSAGPEHCACDRQQARSSETGRIKKTLPTRLRDNADTSLESIKLTDRHISHKIKKCSILVEFLLLVSEHIRLDFVGENLEF